MTEHNAPHARAKEPSGAARQFGGFAPGLIGFTDDVLFGQVWTRAMAAMTVAKQVFAGQSNQ